MALSQVNVLITTFAGLGLPRTLSIPSDSAATVGEVLESLSARLPPLDHRLILTTTSNRVLRSRDTALISSLLSREEDAILPLRLSVPIIGGKGGFGSQLRAAGGRMSSRKKRNQQDERQNGSNRNLDGRRLRTVDAAKKLADYLSKKPEMEEREKEERRKKWENVVELANKREEEIKSGKIGSGSGRLDAEYVESKELAEDKTREAVLKAMREGVLDTTRTGSESSMDAMEDESEEDSDGDTTDSSGGQPAEGERGQGKAFFGWDDDDGDEEEDDDDDDDDESVDDEQCGMDNEEAVYQGKGKARAV